MSAQFALESSSVDLLAFFFGLLSAGGTAATLDSVPGMLMLSLTAALLGGGAVVSDDDELCE